MTEVTPRLGHHGDPASFCYSLMASSFGGPVTFQEGRPGPPGEDMLGGCWVAAPAGASAHSQMGCRPVGDAPGGLPLATL